MSASHDSPPSLCKDTSRVEETLRTRYWCWSLFEEDRDCPTLCALLRSKLPHIDQNSWGERFDFGGIYVNGREALSDTHLTYPCKVEYYEPKFEIRDARSVFPTFETNFVMYADDDIAVAYKPAKLPSMPAKEQRHFSLKASLEHALARTIHMPSRLDVSVQGIVVVSISQRAHAPLQQAFESRRVRKSYRLATTAPCSSDAFTVDLNIVRDRTHPVLRTTSKTEGQSALTHFERSHATLSGEHCVTVLRAYPVSGRTHQIRVHAAAAGVPILGDNFYGDTEANSLHLVSYALNIEHPISGKPLSFVLPSALCPAWVESGG
jgi:tRNA pseudouridine32 synthase/23S rRNA pseudouridine746 synthase